MKRFTDAGRRAVEAGNWYAALTIALILPEICASLESPGPGKSQKRYIEWCRKWLQPEFTVDYGDGTTRVFLSAEDLYQARCSIIHSGTSEVEESKRTGIDRFEFFSDGGHMNKVGRISVNGVKQPSFLQLRVDKFCETVFEAVEKWDSALAGDEAIQAEKAKLLVIRRPGDTVSGVRFEA